MNRRIKKKRAKYNIGETYHSYRSRKQHRKYLHRIGLEAKQCLNRLVPVPDNYKRRLRIRRTHGRLTNEAEYVSRGLSQQRRMYDYLRYPN